MDTTQVRVEDYIYEVPADGYAEILRVYKEGSSPAWRYILRHGTIVRQVQPGDDDYIVVGSL